MSAAASSAPVVGHPIVLEDDLAEIISRTHIAQTSAERERAADVIGELVREVMDGTIVVADSLGRSIDSRIAQIDELISAQLSEVMHAPEFKKLEASWRGLHYLCTTAAGGASVKVKLLNASTQELAKDFRAAVEFDQSALFKKVYEEEFGSFGGAPFGALVGDFEFGRQPEDLYLLEQVSHVAAAAHAPFLSAASPSMFGLSSYADLSKPRDMAKVFDTVEYVKWRSLRASEDGRYVGLTLPRYLGRLPYDPQEGLPTEGFAFREDVDGTDHEKYLWCNAAYAFASRLASAFVDYGWCAAIRGVEGGGLVEDLPTHTFKTGDGELALKCPTEVSITDRREKELSDLGFISLVHCKNTDYAAFFGAQSIQKAARYNTDSANANAILSTQLQYIMAVSRIAHYLKAMMRDKVGSFASPSSVQTFLNDWISQYVLLDDNATHEAKSNFPLREASIQVSEVAGKPGVYRAVAFLRPHFQLDELSVSLRLVTELPAATGG
ncbi:type VI secretion system contractile sheath large subunit [Luteibacter sp. 22Crub2.1]|uniref:type VI secretion system contractile sheath large subunit n=1 Tax=Luteibacter sp. 22Crub2.1 TaxID=1283288 RepID=UPI0009A59DDF|nr:type VI secretion system contractile sheath large subunit [Luteibacter sp. 22Crub2.1]SKB47056.1 type VI secretion system protein ImpC [Luteibacter sp. 22Crub2.1]